VAKVLKGKRQLKRKANTTKRKATLNCSADFTLTRTKQRTTLSSINVRNEEEREEGNNNKLLRVGENVKKQYGNSENVYTEWKDANTLVETGAYTGKHRREKEQSGAIVKK
jgi:hypothetical protein